MTRDVNGIIVSHKLIKEAMHLVDWILKHPSIKVHLINILVWTPLYVQHWICIGVLQSFVFMNGINKCSSHFHLLHWPRYEDIRSIAAVIANFATSYLNQKPISPNMKTSDWKDYFLKLISRLQGGDCSVSYMPQIKGKRHEREIGLKMEGGFSFLIKEYCRG